jgi:acyl-coenzyme A thioesterase PaaI-like protein
MSVHDDVMKDMHDMARKFAEAGINLEMSPPSNSILNTHYTEVDFGKMLAAEFHFDPRFKNPIGTFQGGFLGGAFDEVFGPLTYMAAKRPAMTIEISTTFIRPFSEKTSPMTIRAEVVSRSQSLLILRAEARSPEGKLIATATSNAMITSDRHLSGSGQKTQEA